MDVSTFKKDLEDIYDNVKLNNNGEVAKYIPQLANVNPNLFGISVCTVKGDIINIGDYKEEFCLQSCSKIIVYLLASHLHNSSEVHSHVGHEPSGKAFNDFCFNENNLPHNPMINSGAIMMISMIDPYVSDMSHRYNQIKGFMKKMAGHVGYLGYDNSVYLSERGRGYENRALANMMKAQNAFPENTKIDETLDLYFQTCSITTNTETCSIMAATIANSGVCPVSGETVITAKTVQNCLTLMSTCGMYDYSGGFAFEVGIPAKSGVSGCIMLAIPGVAGICIWSPPLDKKGNSVRGVEVARHLVNRYPHFHTYYNKQTTYKDEVDKIADKSILVQKLIHYASIGDIEKIDAMLSKTDVELDNSDYDGRTSLHLASTGGHLDLVKYLVKRGATVDVKDRFGNTPFSKATLHKDKNESYKEICDYLTQVYYSKQEYRNTPVVGIEKLVTKEDVNSTEEEMENIEWEKSTIESAEYFKSLTSELPTDT